MMHLSIAGLSQCEFRIIGFPHIALFVKMFFSSSLSWIKLWNTLSLILKFPAIGMQYLDKSFLMKTPEQPQLTDIFKIKLTASPP